MSGLSIVDGWFPTLVLIAGIVGLIWLMAMSRRRFLVVVPIAAAVAVLAIVLARDLIEYVWRPFPDALEARVYLWSGLAVFAVALVIAGVVGRARGWLPALVSLVAGILVVVTSLLQVNIVFDTYPTVGALLGRQDAQPISLAQLDDADLTVVGLRQWHPPAVLPAEGRILTAHIPPVHSGFTARPAEIYLPPAMFSSPAPRLPVLILLAGQPGSPGDWFAGGELAQTMNAFADQHRGVSPIVVVADGTGTELGNPLCMDSRLGNAATYLAADVPDWIRTHLAAADPDHRQWAIGGLSYGGTCALQMATNRPDEFPTFLDISGQIEPTLGDRRRTVEATFGGDEAAFLAVNPMTLMAQRRYPDSVGAFVVGADDHVYGPQVRATYAAARAAGMDVHYAEEPGGHSFAVWSAALRHQLPWLARRVGIVR